MRPFHPAAILAILTLCAACATEEPIRFSDGGCVAGGCQSVGASMSAGSCTPNPSCAVSFKTDIFQNILDGPAGCTGAMCHASSMPNGNLALDTGMPDAAYTQIINYVLKGGTYVVPCSPQASKMLCNLAVAGTNPYPPCGISMPVGKQLTQAQFDQISEWIACGAPAN